MGNRTEISVHRAKVFLALKSTAGRWVTNPEVYSLLPDVSPCVIREETLNLFKRGILERIKGHPFYYYRWSTRREGRDHDFEIKMAAACEAFGLAGSSEVRPAN